jgi:hypothetical protein
MSDFTVGMLCGSSVTVSVAALLVNLFVSGGC